MVFESIRVPIANRISLIILIINVIKRFFFASMDKNDRRKFFQSFDNITCYDALIVAIKMGYKNEVKVLINRHKWIEDGDTQLTIAIKRGHLKIVDYIINLAKLSYLDLDSLVKKGETALSIAIMYGNPEMVELIIENVEYLEHMETARMFGNEPGDPLLIKAIKRGNPIIVRLLIKAGVNVEIYDNEGKTALYHAIWNDNMEIIPNLIEATKIVENLIYPFDLACEKRNSQVIIMLIKAGVDKMCQAQELGMAIREKDSDMVELLLNAGATPCVHNILKVVAKMPQCASLILEKATDDVKEHYESIIELEEERHRKHMASRRIHRFWRDVNYDPKYAKCRSNLARICNE